MQNVNSEKKSLEIRTKTPKTRKNFDQQTITSQGFVKVGLACESQCDD